MSFQALTKLAEKLAHVCYEQLGYFKRGEVAAAGHLGPVHEIVTGFDPLARGDNHRLVGMNVVPHCLELFPRITVQGVLQRGSLAIQ